MAFPQRRAHLQLHGVPHPLKTIAYLALMACRCRASLDWARRAATKTRHRK